MIQTTDSAPPNYPPYGHMVLEWERQTRDPKTPPGAWHGTLGYDEWRENIVELLSTVLWPRYVRKERQWRGKAKDFMHQLTRTDFALFPRFRRKIHDDAGLGEEKITQYQLFILEDEADAIDVDGTIKLDRSVDASLRKYLAAGKVGKKQAEHLASGYIIGLAAKSGNVDLDIKVDMQRPRAYQVAWLLDIDFDHQHAKSAVTPSMISGHCLEILMGGVACFLRARDIGCPKSGIEMIAQHTVDVGDRRVFGGVHYASDNISSWLTGLLLCPHVCHGREGREWLWEAIRTKSVVYRELEPFAKTPEGAVYAESMELLRKIGEGEIETVCNALDMLRARAEAEAEAEAEDEERAIEEAPAKLARNGRSMPAVQAAA